MSVIKFEFEESVCIELHVVLARGNQSSQCVVCSGMEDATFDNNNGLGFQLTKEMVAAFHKYGFLLVRL